MKKTITPLVLGMVLLSGSLSVAEPIFDLEDSQAVTAQYVQVREAEVFVTLGAEIDLFEVTSSEMAQTRTENDAVKDLAQHLLNSHSASRRHLLGLAEQLGITVTTASVPMAMNNRRQGMLKQLLSSADGFDVAFAELQVVAHKEAIALYEAYARGGDQPQLREFATETIPALRQHLTMAERVLRESRRDQ